MVQLVIKSRVASHICSWAPFLVPPNARTFTAFVTHTSGTYRKLAKELLYSTHVSGQTRKYGNRSNTGRRSKRKGRTSISIDEQKQIELAEYMRNLTQISYFREAVVASNIDTIQTHYPLILRNPAFSSRDTFELARSLHNDVRQRPYAEKRDAFEFLEKVIADYRERKLPPHPLASLRFLSYLNETAQYEAGLDLWDWLFRQDEEYADQRTYGAAIELLASCGEPLEVLEKLYSYTLQKFPGQFSEYHLSPDAVLQDRSQPIVLKGSSLTLLQGIVQARLLHRDWKGAYLGLDTALRLFPTQIPTDFFSKFISGRPASEAYTVFLLACRTGTPASEWQFSSVLLAMSNSSKLGDTVSNACLANCMLNALYSYLGAGGKVDTLMLNLVLKTLVCVLPVGSPPSEEKAAQLYDVLYEMVLWTSMNLIDAFTKAGNRLEASTFNNIISAAVDLQNDSLVHLSVDLLHKSGVKETMTSYLAKLAASGRIGDVNLAVESLSGLLDHFPAHEGQTKQKIRKTLVKATRRLSSTDLEQRVLPLLQTPERSDLWIDVVNQVLSESRNRPEDEPKSAFAELEDLEIESYFTDLRPVLGSIVRRVDDIMNMMKSPTLLDFSLHPIPLIPPSEIVPSAELDRGLYDELTTDPTQHTRTRTTPPAIKPTISPTGYVLDELRFLNWRAVNWLLAEAEYNERQRETMIEAAIEAHSGVDQARRKGAVFDSVRYKAVFQETDGIDIAEAESPESWSMTSAAAEIKRLRGYEREHIGCDD